MSERCLFCDKEIQDQRAISGSDKVDWATYDGDFGCDSAPGASSEGCGSHYPISEAREVVIATVFQV